DAGQVKVSAGKLDSISNSNLLGSPETPGLLNTTQTQIDADNNHWDAADGPSGEGPGSGVPIEGPIGLGLFQDEVITTEKGGHTRIPLGGDGMVVLGNGIFIPDRESAPNPEIDPDAP